MPDYTANQGMEEKSAEFKEQGRRFIRMAVGQLFDYWFRLKGNAIPHLAILLPNPPDSKVKKLLEWLEIGVMWFSKEDLETSTSWLEGLVGSN